MNRPVHHTKCPICHHSQLEDAGTATDHLVSERSFTLCRCSNCGFTLTQDRPADNEISTYYESQDYVSHSDTRRGLIPSLYHLVRTYMLGRKARLVIKYHSKSTSKPGPATLLDIGTGTGYFAHTMQQRGWTVKAVEPGDQPRRFAQSHFNLQVVPALSDVESNKKFDVITLWHVLEHIGNLHTAWDTLRLLLSPAGTLIIAVPNPTSFDAQHYGTRWAAYDVPRHLWHFSPHNLQHIAAEHGFNIQNIRPMPLDAFYIAILTEQQQGHPFAFLRGISVGLRAWCAQVLNPRRASSLIYILTPIANQKDKP